MSEEDPVPGWEIVHDGRFRRVEFLMSETEALARIEQAVSR